MKNKKLSWVLLPVVVVIWAMIGWKVYASMSAEDDQFVPGKVDSGQTNNLSNVPDTYQLSLDYRDPFLDARSAPKKNTHASAAQNSVPPKKIDAEPPVKKEPPSIQYFGLVKEKTSNKTVGFLRVNGESFFVKQNDLISEITIIRLWRDSVEVRYDAKKSVIRK
jgi:hypothetical protein